MNEISTLAVNYFRPYRDYFWHWAEGVDVIEWKVDGETICYREDLLEILKGISHKGLPPLGAVLLIMAACQDLWRDAEKNYFDVLAGLLEHIEKHGDPSDDMLTYQIHQACKFLDIISELPPDLRRGAGRMHLIQQTLDEIAFEFSTEDSRAILDEFNSGRLDKVIPIACVGISRKRFKLEIGLLNKAVLRYGDVHMLERVLRTGLENIPSPAALEVAGIEQPDVLEELEADPKTQAIARLTQRLIAAINIPMHAQGSSDRPIGGVSDITNRGNFDRLLLSELAYDDQMLMARLVNNEALYLRREEPPARLNRRRTILIDTTIKLWGTPRVFALCAALACAKDQKHRGSIAAYALGGDQYREVTLTNKKGVLDALACLDPALHCVEALNAFIEEQPAFADSECILISDENIAATPRFQLLMREMQQPIRYLITVSRSGALEIFGYHQGNSKLLSTASLDLQDLLSAPSHPKSNRLAEPTELPAFMNHKPSPLYFPPIRVNPTSDNSYYVKELGVFSVSEVQRLLFWSGRDKGAKELLSYVEPGNYCFGCVATGTLSILVTNPIKTLVKLYAFTPEADESRAIDLSETLLDVQEVVYFEANFYIKTWEGIIAIDAVSGKMSKPAPKHRAAFDRGKLLRKTSEIYPLKSFVQSGYHVLINVQEIYVNEQGGLALDHQHLQVLTSSHLKFDNKKAKQKKAKVGRRIEPDTSLAGNSKIKLRRWIWADGSEAVVDSRGLLHLKSADATLPEITLVLALGKATAAWAANGALTGAEYFTGINKSVFLITDKQSDTGTAPAKVKDASSWVAPSEFYRDYIKPFIDNLH